MYFICLFLLSIFSYTIGTYLHIKEGTINYYFWVCASVIEYFFQWATFAEQSESDYDGPMSVTLFHSLSNEVEPEWELRGQLTVQNAALKQLRLEQSQKNNILSLGDKDSYYRLKAVVTTSQGKEIEFFSFVKACALVETQLTDVLTISLDHEGCIIAVTLSTPLSSCGTVSVDSIPSDFKTNVDFRTIEQGPVPDTASYIQKIEREREARERGEVKDNRSFIAKYWMYIIPVLVFVVLSGASNPEGAAGGGGGGR